MAKILITEEKEKELYDYIVSESFVPHHNLVLRVKSFLDKTFKSQLLDDIDEYGQPKKVYSVVMMSGNQPIKTYPISELLLYLDDKFHDIIKDDKDRKNFLKQVIRDWLNKAITKEGILSVNYID